MKGAAIAEAVAVACGRGEQTKSGLAQAIEEATSKTIAEAYEEGLAGDQEEIARRMAETRARVKQEFFAPQESNLEG